MTATAYVSNDGNDYAALAPQAAVGTPTVATSAFTFFRWLDDTTGVDHDRVQTTEREGGDGQDMALAYIEHHTGKTTVGGYARPDALAKLLAWCFGIGTMSSAASTLPYTHLIWPADQARLMTWEGAAPKQTIIEQLMDSKISEVKLEAEHGKPLKVTAAITGGDSPRQLNVASAKTVTLETEDPFYFNTGSYALAISGALAGNDGVTKWTCTFTREQDDGVFGVGYGRKAITDLNRTVTLDVTRKYESAADHNAVLYAGGTVGAPTVATGAWSSFMTNGKSGSALRTFRFDIPLMVLSPLQRNVYEPDGQTVYEDLSAVALKARGGTHLAWAQLQTSIPTAIASGLL